MTLGRAFDLISTAMVAVAAIAMGILYFNSRIGDGTPPGPEQTFVDDWRDWAESANRIGAKDAPMVVAAFMDFSCSYCKALLPVLDSLSAEFPGDVVIEFHYFPLKGREFQHPERRRR